MRKIIAQDPFTRNDPGIPWDQRGQWPASWVAARRLPSPPYVVAYRLAFALPQAATATLHVTADERYELFLDGERVGRGSERGDADHWFYETYELELPAGPHTLVARVWSLGPLAPYAQLSVRHGFLLAAEPPLTEALSTGIAPWEAKRLEGYSWVNPSPAWGTGGNIALSAAQFPWGFERGEGDGWEPVEVVERAVGRLMALEAPPQHLLRPATLPAMLEVPIRVGRVRHVSAPSSEEVSSLPIRAEQALDEPEWQAMLEGRGSVTVPPHTTRRVIIDLEDYYCAYPELVTSGGEGGAVRLHWAESLYEDGRGRHKGDRDAIEGKYFRGVGDVFLPDGGDSRRFDTLWWQAGRYLELLVRTADSPLTVASLRLRETRYPLEMESAIATGDPDLDATIPLMVRAMQMCSHETYMDCPYYEQLMYAGDTRLEALVTYVMTRDDRLPRKALRMFDASRLPSGLTQARYPSRVRQIIAPFALWWVAMVCDYAYWRPDTEYVRELMPGVRATMEAFERWRGSDGLLESPEGWNVTDWVPEWPAGIPPEGEWGRSGLLNWHLALVTRMVADLERALGNPQMAEHFGARAREIADAALRAFWVPSRGLMADDTACQRFSEHTQCLAILSGLLPPAIEEQVGRSLLEARDIARTTIYFSHYLFEACRKLGRVDVLLARLGLWRELVDRGLRTTIEAPEPTRSDCHAWGAHPLYHLFATFLGIRPAGLGFSAVEIAPQPAALRRLEGRLVHPKGDVWVAMEVEEEQIRARVRLPEAVPGVFCWGSRRVPLRPGEETDVVLPRAQG